MSYATLTWEISTSDAGRHVRIASAVDRALSAFAACRLLSDTVMLDTRAIDMDEVRDAFDAVAEAFPAEFFYHSADHAATDILQGDYPPWAELAAAHRMTGSNNIPFDRRAEPPAAATLEERGRRRRRTSARGSRGAGSKARRRRDG